MRATALFIITLVTSISAFSQITQPYRFEKKVKVSEDDFTIIPLKEDGLALVRGTNTYKSGNRNWELIVLDTTLQEKWSLEFEVDNQCKLVGMDHSPGFIHMLFVKNEISGEMRLVTAAISTREINKYEIRPELDYKLTHFSSVGTNFIFAGFINLEPCVMVFNPSNINLKVIPGFFQKNTELMDVRVNQNQTFNTIILDRNNQEEPKIVFKTFDSSGKQLLEDITGIDNSITIQTSICSSLNRDELLIFGTWGKRNSRQANGFYVLPINPFSEDKIQTVYLGQLDHYLDYLKPKKAYSIKQKTKKSLEQKEIPSFTNYVMPHRIIEHARGFMMLAESYTPPTKSNQSGYYTPNYGYSPYYYSPYSPYQYYPTRRYTQTPYGDNMVNVEEMKKIESVVINFDSAGNKYWDFSLTFDDFKVESSRQVSELQLETDTLHVIYKKESDLKIKSTFLSTGESREQTQKVRLSEPTSEIRSEEKHIGAVEYWYVNNFYVWGFQTIRNTAKGADRNKDVFYVNKITFR